MILQHLLCFFIIPLIKLRALPPAPQTQGSCRQFHVTMSARGAQEGGEAVMLAGL